MKKILLIIKLIFLPIIIEAQVIDWNNFNERKMDTVMFNIMNNYVKTIHSGDSLIWSPVVQNEVMQRNYNSMKNKPGNSEVHKLHNMEWCNDQGNSIPLTGTIKSDIIKENINPTFLKSQMFTYSIDKKGHTATAYGNFDYYEILESVNGIKDGQTYQELANVCIVGWNRSTEGHSQIMNANYKNKVIVGVITLYIREFNRTLVSFVYID